MTFITLKPSSTARLLKYQFFIDSGSKHPKILAPYFSAVNNKETFTISWNLLHIRTHTLGKPKLVNAPHLLVPLPEYER
ncbi:hypothetical protein HMPREF0742_01644 [Rothia aeria F0184]|uniref:Uncharacterized protein n=1 Tax=Rothia aeria F0184 TaxID=888019 RepID=U7V210_9MICC|nr:hypothetical protein HMPREF0742_01644 [Rothia aeria F0184]